MKRTSRKVFGKLMARAAFVCMVAMFASYSNAADRSAGGGGSSISATLLTSSE